MEIGYLGIDVSKGYSDFVLLSSNKGVLEDAFQLDDSQQGHVTLLNLLHKFRKKHGLIGVNAVLESTGGYENNWHTFLKNEGHWANVRIGRVNPYGVKHDGIAGMERTITDATSARRIALYALNHPEKINWEEAGYNAMDSLRSMYNYIRTRVKQKVQLQNQLEKLLYTAFPELLPYTQEQLPKWLLNLLYKYPTASAMRDASIGDLALIKGITNERAAILLRKAEQSISWADNPVLRQVIQGYAKDIADIIQQVENLKKSLEQQKEIPQGIQVLESFQGIGRYSAIGIMIEVEDITRFESSKRMCSFFGVHPKFKQSGDKIAGIRMSKQGSPEMRAILYMVAMSSLVYNPHIRKIYDRFKGQGMAHNQAMGVVMHKILRIIYGMLKSKTEYIPEIDIENQQRVIVSHKGASKVQTEGKKKQRYQELSTDAPISKIELKKRKEQLSSPSP